MRCTGCGLPLSPQRTHCPRCGKAAGEPDEKSLNQAEVAQYAFPSLNMGGFQQQPTAVAQQQAPEQVYYATGTEQFPGQSNQMVLSDPEQTLQVNPAQRSDWQAFSQTGSASPDGIRVSEFRPFSGSTRPRRTVQPGFTVAGLCVLSGGLILLLVYIISLNLSSLAPRNQSVPLAASTPTQVLSTGPQAGVTATPPTLTVIPSPSLPGKTYIDNAQVGSSLILNTAQLSQVATTFTVNQKIFVTFMVHSPNTGGAVCLNWYVNQKQFSQFAFAVGVGSQHAYSYTFASGAGAASVSIYWASSDACADKILAQVVTFTVTP